MEHTTVSVSRASQSLVVTVTGPTQVGVSRRPAYLPPKSRPTPVVTASANAVVESRERGKNTQMVELGTQVRVLQTQQDVLQSSPGALSPEWDNLYRKHWEGTIRGLLEEFRTLRRDVKRLLEDLAGYPDFQDNVNSEFRKVLGRLKTLDAAVKADDTEKEKPRRSLNAHRSERSFTRCKQQDRSRCPSLSSTSSDNSHRHSISSEDSDKKPRRHRRSRSQRTRATVVQVGSRKRIPKHAGLK